MARNSKDQPSCLDSMRGFSLIELLVAMSILCVLVGGILHAQQWVFHSILKIDSYERSQWVYQALVENIRVHIDSLDLKNRCDKEMLKLTPVKVGCGGLDNINNDICTQLMKLQQPEVGVCCWQNALSFNACIVGLGWSVMGEKNRWVNTIAM